jgi:hypothetical protein
MLYEAAIVAAEMRVMPKAAALGRPDVARWLDGWGREGDVGVIATNGTGDPLGATWACIYAARERGLGIVARPGVDTDDPALGTSLLMRAELRS